jgi:Rod binding domain-containing protein
MSSISMIAPQVSLSDVRGTQAAEKLKNTSEAGKAKIQKSAKEFEAVLMSHWLEQAEQSFATVPGGDPDADPSSGHDQFQSIAMQAVATAMSGNHGGLGIATMVAKHLDARHAAQPDPNVILKIKDLKASPASGIPLKASEWTK